MGSVLKRTSHPRDKTFLNAVFDIVIFIKESVHPVSQNRSKYFQWDSFQSNWSEI